MLLVPSEGWDVQTSGAWVFRVQDEFWWDVFLAITKWFGEHRKWVQDVWDVVYIVEPKSWNITTLSVCKQLIIFRQGNVFNYVRVLQGFWLLRRKSPNPCERLCHEPHWVAISHVSCCVSLHHFQTVTVPLLGVFSRIISSMLMTKEWVGDTVNMFGLYFNDLMTSDI